MSVRVVARIRPLLKAELDKDVIVEATPSPSRDGSTLVRIPNPRNESEAFSFQFNSVYDQTATQQQLFDEEGLKQLLGRRMSFLTRQQLRLQLSISSKVSMSPSSHMGSRVPARRTPCEAERRWQTAG